MASALIHAPNRNQAVGTIRYLFGNPHDSTTPVHALAVLLRQTLDA